MQDSVSFYPQLTKYGFEASLAAARRNNRIQPAEEKVIREYLNEKAARDHITLSRKNKITTTLVNFRRFLKAEYQQATAADIFEAINQLTSGKTVHDKPFKQNTLWSYIRIIKPFMLWLIESGYSTIQPQKIKVIKAPAIDTDTSTPEDIITPEEIKTLIQACKHSRDRALLGILYESGARIGEIARLTWKDCIFDKYGAKLYITDTKTKKQRYARLTASSEYLASWRNDCPDPTPTALVFTNLHDGSPIEYITVRRLLERTIKASGINKKITKLHLFRKSRITHLIAQNYQESVVKQAMWGNLETRMFKTYVQLGERDIDNEFLEKAGIQQKPAELIETLKPRPCPNCHGINAPTSSYCSKCGAPITDSARQDVEYTGDTLREMLAKNPAAVSALGELLKDLNRQAA
ncbi:MAG: tyrosine-type recombinase/integrase [Methanoregulaceae archaeon]|nr:tyrosine-type recombinase/integrase [Methanoregulaceae archaeon]